jgi:MscS family membrane protein
LTLRLTSITAVFCLLLPLQLAAQIPVSAPAKSPSASAAPDQTPPDDTLNRSTPRETVVNFLRACNAGNYVKAADYLDLTDISGTDRKRQGPEIALQIEQILKRNSDFDASKLSDSPDGNLNDLRKRNRELIDTVNIHHGKRTIELERVELRPGLQVWLFSADTVSAIPGFVQLLGESAIEKSLPEFLVKTTFLDTALWCWIALILLVLALGPLARFISRLVLGWLRPFLDKRTKRPVWGILQMLIEPVGLLLGVFAYGIGVGLIGPSAIVRFYISRILTLLFFLAIAWFISRLVEVLANRLRVSTDPRQQAMYQSVLPLGLRVAKIVLFTIAVVTTISVWGYNTATIWGTLGIGSLALALAAQKTLENFFGGVSVIADRSVLVGDFCRVGDQVGTVEDIGLRSTRIRTNGRTMLTVPNSQFSTMTLENYSRRDKMWFHPTISLRCDANPSQVRQVIVALGKILEDHPLVEVGKIPVRFTGIASYSYDVEIFAYVLTSQSDDYLKVQTDLLLQIIDVVEAAGTGLAVPLQEVTGPATIANGSKRTIKADEYPAG